MTTELALLDIDTVHIGARTSGDHISEISHSAQAKSNAFGILSMFETHEPNCFEANYSKTPAGCGSLHAFDFLPAKSHRKNTTQVTGASKNLRQKSSSRTLGSEVCHLHWHLHPPTTHQFDHHPNHLHSVTVKQYLLTGNALATSKSLLSFSDKTTWLTTSSQPQKPLSICCFGD